MDAQLQVVRKLEEKERLLQGTISTAERELALRTQALDMNKRKVKPAGMAPKGLCNEEIPFLRGKNKNSSLSPGSGICNTVRRGESSAGAGSAETQPGQGGSGGEQHLKGERIL